MGSPRGSRVPTKRPRGLRETTSGTLLRDPAPLGPLPSTYNPTCPSAIRPSVGTSGSSEKSPFRMEGSGDPFRCVTVEGYVLREIVGRNRVGCVVFQSGTTETDTTLGTGSAEGGRVSPAQVRGGRVGPSVGLHRLWVPVQGREDVGPSHWNPSINEWTCYPDDPTNSLF